MYKSVFGGAHRPTITISCWPYWWHLAGYGPLYRSGVSAVIPMQRSVPAHLIDPKVKNRSRVYYQMANLQVQRIDPQAWALLTDDQGLITEGTGFNFFIVRKGRVYTPPGRNILLGITRQAVLELLPQLAIPVVEEDFGLYEVINADEAFFTGYIVRNHALHPCEWPAYRKRPAGPSDEQVDCGMERYGWCRYRRPGGGVRPEGPGDATAAGPGRTLAMSIRNWLLALKLRGGRSGQCLWGSCGSRAHSYGETTSTSSPDPQPAQCSAANCRGFQGKLIGSCAIHGFHAQRHR